MEEFIVLPTKIISSSQAKINTKSKALIHTIITKINTKSKNSLTRQHNQSQVYAPFPYFPIIYRPSNKKFRKCQIKIVGTIDNTQFNN